MYMQLVVDILDVKAYSIHTYIYFRSDHYNFAKHGVPIIFYYDGMLDADYHKPTDTPDKINYELMVKRDRLIFHTAWEMANRDDMLKRDIPLEAPKGF